ncbi:MAG TPA: contractile injection system tape measure protein [Chitinophagales bacterium]|nr:contractile injection system tape measure protein [Chitinophagales bacterium]HRK26905.1 contractile injection system tape measure protein [Chitinophagales bacterium]
MIPQRHHITKQVFDLQMPDEKNAFLLQNRWVSVFKDRIVPQMQDIFDRYVPQDTVISIDALTLDIGILETENWEQLFLSRFTAQLEKYLQENLQALAAQPQLVADSGNLQTLKPHEVVLRQLAYYLQYGVFNLHQTTLPFTQLFDETELLLNQQPEEVVKLLQTLRNNDTAMLRLVKQFPVQVIHKIVSHSLSPGVFSQLEQMRHPVREILNNPLINRLLQLPPGILPAANFAQIWLLSTLQLALLPQASGISFSAMALQEVILSVINHLLPNLPTAALEMHKAIARFIAMQPLPLNTSKIADAIIEQVLPQFQNNAISPKADLTNNLNPTANDTPVIKLPDADNEQVTQNINPQLKEKSQQPHTKPPVAKVTTLKPAPSAIPNYLYIQNAGLVLVWVYLSRLFKSLELTLDNRFKNPSCSEQAVYLLQYIASGQTTAVEPDLALNKILCGVIPQMPIEPEIILPDTHLQAASEMLEAAIKNWSKLGKTGIGTFQTTFLQREGKLHRATNGWELTVEQRGVDILLDFLPYSINIVKLPWMPDMVWVNWR